MSTDRSMKILLTVVALASLLGCGVDEGPWHIPGSAELPECLEAPDFDLDGSRWADNGSVQILTSGCGDFLPGEEHVVCGLAWVFAQSGADVEIMVDNEYRIHARLCGDQLHLQGGWWLPVEDEGFCTYEEDSAEEVGIQDGGSTLTIVDDPMGGLWTATGTLLLGGPCEASYDVTLTRFM